MHLLGTVIHTGRRMALSSQNPNESCPRSSQLAQTKNNNEQHKIASRAVEMTNLLGDLPGLLASRSELLKALPLLEKRFWHAWLLFFAKRQTKRIQTTTSRRSTTPRFLPSLRHFARGRRWARAQNFVPKSFFVGIEMVGWQHSWLPSRSLFAPRARRRLRRQTSLREVRSSRPRIENIHPVTLLNNKQVHAQDRFALSLSKSIRDDSKR